MKRRSFNMESVKELLNSDIYKGIFLLIFLISLIIFNMINKDLAFENAFLYFISYPLYILFMMMILFIASIYTSKILDTKFNIILRYSNKKEYFRSLLVYVTVINGILFSFSIMVNLILLLCSYWRSISFTQLDYYHIPYFIYNIFSVFKYFLVVNFLCLIIVQIRKCFNYIMSAALMVILLILKLGFVYSTDIIDNISKIKLFFGYYLYPFQYASFSLELCASFLQITILLLFIKFLFSFINKYCKIEIME